MIRDFAALHQQHQQQNYGSNGLSNNYNQSSSLAQIQLNRALLEVDNRNSSIGNSMEDFKIVGELGRGSYGTVFKVTSMKDNEIYVLKKISLKHMKQKQQQAALKEVQILKTLDHPHVIKYFTSFMEEESIHIVMEFAEQGDLYRLLKEQRQKRKYFSEKDLWDFSYQICMATEYLHGKNIIHRDIKCLNIFLTNDKRIKLGDLGVSKIVSSAAALQDTRVGTPLYLSPELVKQQPYDFKVDIWAIGCAIYHLAQLEPPFQGDNLITLGNNIVNKKPKALPQIYSNKLINFIDRFLLKKPQERPSAKEAVQLVPSFVKQAYTENTNRRNLFKLDTDNNDPSDTTLPKQQLISENPIKSPASLKRVHPSDSQIQFKKVETNVVKIVENNHHVNQAKSNTLNSQRKIQQESQVKIPIVSSQKDINIVEASPQSNKYQSNNQLQFAQIINEDTPKQQHKQAAYQSLVQTKSPTTLKQQQPSTQQPPLKPLQQQQPSSIQPFFSNQSSQHQNNKQSILSNKDHNTHNTQGIQSTKDETAAGTKQNNQVRKNHVVQFQMESALIKISNDNKQEKQQQVKQENNDYGQEEEQRVMRREMPYNARPQTASASQMFMRRQQQSSCKPGISLLRNLVKRTATNESLDPSSSQNSVAILNSHFAERPFSAVVQHQEHKKKNVMFEEVINKENQSDYEIVQDDEGSNEQDYLQFDMVKEEKKVANHQGIKRDTVSAQYGLQIKNNVTIYRKPIGNGIRPSTANVSTNMQYRSVSQQSSQGFRLSSYDPLPQSSQQQLEIRKPAESLLHHNSNQQARGSTVSTLEKRGPQIIQSIESEKVVGWQKLQPSKNDLNRQSSKEYDDQFGRFFKSTFRKNTVQSAHTSQQQFMNNQQLKDKIKSLQPATIHAQLCSSSQLPPSGSIQESSHNLLSQHQPSVNSNHIPTLPHKQESPRQHVQIIKKNPAMPAGVAQARQAVKKITIRDLEPINKQSQ